MIKNLLFISAIFAIGAQQYCATIQNATTPHDASATLPTPAPLPISQNVSVGAGSVQSCYQDADFVLKFGTDSCLSCVVVSISGEVRTFHGVEVFADSRSSWLGIWGENYVRIFRDGVTEVNVDGKKTIFAPKA